MKDIIKNNSYRLSAKLFIIGIITLMGLLGETSLLNLFGPVGGLVAGIQNANQRPSSGPLDYLGNVAKNFSRTTTSNVGAMGFPTEYGLNPTQQQQQQIINKATTSTGLPSVNLSQQTPISSGGGSGGGGNNGGTGGFSMDYYPGWDPTAALADWNATGGAKGRQGGGQSGPSYEDIMRGQIGEGYNNYFGQLDQMMIGLGDQRTAHENLANTQYLGSLSDLNTQNTQNLADLDIQRRKAGESQVKSLKDISTNIRNLMQAGNTYLGGRGAGDSSAVNQYAYALTKLGSQQRGDVTSQTNSIMNDINDRESRLAGVYTQEKNRLNTERDSAVQDIASWFADSQNQIRQARATGELNKSQDLQSLTQNLYNQALQQLAYIQNTVSQKQSQLETWALNNSKSLAQAKQNLAGIANFVAPTQTYQQISGTPSFDSMGNMGVQFRGGGTGGFGLTEDQKRLLGIA